MKDIPPIVAQYHISLILRTKAIRQKKRHMNPQFQMIVKRELKKLLQDDFIKSMGIIDWISSIVLIKKKNGKLRLCIDYKKFNEHIYKDHFFSFFH